MKKKTVLLLACIVFNVFNANAQFGDVLRKAAQKAAQKTTEKLTDKAAEKAAEKAADAIEKELDKAATNSKAKSDGTETSDQITYAALMAQAPELPTVQQLANYKDAELNEQALKLMVSPVTSFQTKLLGLSMQAATLYTNSADSAQIVDAAYKNAQMATGLSREELEHLATLPEDQQQAYIQAHYKNGTAEAALIEQAAEAGKYLEPLQPLIDRWDNINNQIDQLYAQTETKCKEIYKKHADKLAKTSDKEHNKALIKYYTEILPLVHTAVQQAMKMRLDEQLPIAEEIEHQMVDIRTQHQDAISLLLNYPRLTATQYFTEPSRLLEIPEYSE